MSSSDRTDAYTRITQDIIRAIEAGTSTFRMSWHHDGAAVTRPVNIASKKPYRGINTVSLWASAQANGFSRGIWGTYRQWQAEGAQVREGETASLAVLWKVLRREDTGGEEDQADTRSRIDALR